MSLCLYQAEIRKAKNGRAWRPAHGGGMLYSVRKKVFPAFDNIEIHSADNPQMSEPMVIFFDCLCINFIQGRAVICFAFFISFSPTARNRPRGGRHKVDNCNQCSLESRGVLGVAPRSTHRADNLQKVLCAKESIWFYEPSTARMREHAN